MTNYEKYKDQIDWQARAGVKLAVRKSDNTPTICGEISCKECLFGGSPCRIPAIEWLKAEYAEPEIEVGDEVEIIDGGRCYTAYASWVTSNVPDVYRRLKYDFGNAASNGDIGIVKEKGLHCSNNKMLYYIELNATGRCYLISEDGIKLSGGNDSRI